MASFSFNRTIRLNNVVYRQISQTEWLNTETNQKLSSTALSLLITASKTKQTITPPPITKAEGESFYNRIVKIGGVFYKQISSTRWQNMATGQIFSNISNLLYLGILQTKEKTAAAAVTPSEGITGACCEIVNGVMQCSVKAQEACSNGCFKGTGTNCNATEENPNPCDTCVHCCFAGSGCLARTASACLAAGGTYFAGGNGCTACKLGVCSTDSSIKERFLGNGCTGIFVEGGGVSSFDEGIYCTGSGFGQTCGGTGYRYQELTSTFIVGGTCSACINGACCTGGTCAGILSQTNCSAIGGLFYPGSSCSACDYGIFCSGATTNRTCLGAGYRGEKLSEQFQKGATCSYCITGTCCVNGTVSFGDNVRQSNCTGNFFSNRFASDACATGSCCVGAQCDENVFRYDCLGTFNPGMTCIACTDGACCLANGCTLTSFSNCFAQGGTFYGGATCSACDSGSCCNSGNCANQLRGQGCTGTFYANVNCSSLPCSLGVCCVGSTCAGTNIARIQCELISGDFHAGATCIMCATGANCVSPEDPESFENYTCRLVSYGNFLGTDPNGYFGFGKTCSACDIGSCCASVQSGNQSSVGIRGNCDTSTGVFNFFSGQTLTVCATGVFCTGSNEGQTCFGLGYRGQSLTSNFIQGATCSACILGACCTGGTCLAGGITSQSACVSAGGVFFAGRTCAACDYGVFCSGATCLSLGFRGQSLSANFITGATCSACILGACCTGGTCSGGGQTSQAACKGLFYPGATCRACDYGVYCTGSTCGQLGYRAEAITSNFIQGATCSGCILGACCAGGTCSGGGQTAQSRCSGGTFYAGATCSTCVTGVFCTGSGVGQTCFGLGHRGQSFTNNFIAGGTCSDCILGACCTGGTCYGGTLTTQLICNSVAGLFFAGTTCNSCVYGVYCTGADENTSCIGLGYKAQNLSNRFIVGGNCVNDCVYGSCCQGITCLGITGQGNCPKPNSFFAGMTCQACDTGQGACCTGGSSSITNISGCNSLGGIFFPDGTTALCVTGSCCTGGTCSEELFGRSGNCQLFISGATCGICDSGVFCTGATCLQTGLRGLSLSDVFISGQTCSSCILGICCTGGTCIGGGETLMANCPSNVGLFVSGATVCSACQVSVNCCLPGNTCSYILKEQCLAQNGIVFEGAEDCSLCTPGAFCTGNTCAGFTLRGFDLTDTFIVNESCDSCITGVCCDENYDGTITTKAACNKVFYAGATDTNICSVGKTFGICCNQITNACTEDVEQTSCNGYFIPNTIAEQNSIYCASNPCQFGICCKENNITSITGGVCLGEMRRAQCSITGGDFFPTSEGYTCSNCIYTPMLASVLLNNVSSDASDTFKPTIRTGSRTGHTGNELQPRIEYPAAGKGNNWINGRSDGRYYKSASMTSANTGPIPITKEAGYLSMTYLNLKYTTDTPFYAWYGPTLTTGNEYGVGSSGNWQGITGTFDYSPVFNQGFTRQNSGASFGYIDGTTFESPRYARLVFGYGNPDDPYHNKSITWRFSHTDGSARIFSRSDAARHAMLDPNVYNLLITSPGDPFSNNLGDNNYSSPVLVQMFAENPLSHRIRPVGSCCKGKTCIGIITQDHCTSVGGTFNLNGNCARCFPELILGNCCLGGTYSGYTSLANCNKISGTFFEGITTDTTNCRTGIICNSNRTCYQGVSYSYFGDFSSADGRYFVEGDYRFTVGCAACDAGICCTGGTCMGVMPKTSCEAIGGKTSYLNSCGTVYNNCELGVCCPFESGCGTYTTRGECTGVDKIFVAGASLGATCSACNSMMRLTESTPGVTYTFVFNKGTTYGRFYDNSLWVQETDDLRVRRVRINYVGMTSGDPGYTFYSNTVISDMIVHPSGLRGTLYAHGAAKNLQPFFYVDNVAGVLRDDTEPFTSLSYEDYNSGWKGPKTPGATDVAANYSQFNLPKFLDMKDKLDNNGVTLGAGDLFVVNTTNFNPYRVETEWKTYVQGYPYQLFYRRANTLTYGILNCVGSTVAATINSIGSTLCFRPPTTWPLNDKENRPIFSVNMLEGRIPGQTGITLITLTSSGTDKNFTLNYASPVSDAIASSYTQVSEYGGGSNYGTTTPIWSMYGARSTNTSYGDQYLVGLNQLHQMAYATGPAYYNKDLGVTSNPKVTIAQRKDMIARVVQYGIDSWGAHRAFTVLGAGAGQKAARTRPWVTIAGYYLGVTSMYDPEATLLLDTERMQKWYDYLFTDDVTCSPKTDCVTEAEWRRWRIGGSTGPEGNYRGLRRQLAQWGENAALTTYEFKNEPSNPILHYSYVGEAYRLGFQNHSPTGLTGITFYNEIGVTRELTQRVTVYGDFGVIRWGSETGATSTHPDPRNPFVDKGYYGYDKKAGVDAVFTNTWLRVESGPGSSGGQGSRYYRIIDMNDSGFRNGSSEGSDSRPMSTLGGGYQIVIGQTWADGVPDYTSKIQIYPFIESDFGITRPCLLCPSGFTVGTIPGYITVANPDGGCGSTFSTMPECILWEANAGVGPYYATAVSGWINTFYFLKHITTTKGITLISDAFPVTDYLDMRFYTSPFNLYAFDQIEPNTSNNSVLSSWMPQGIYNVTEITKRINFSKYFPGIRRYVYGEQAPVTIW